MSNVAFDQIFSLMNFSIFDLQSVGVARRMFSFYFYFYFFYPPWMHLVSNLYNPTGGTMLGKLTMWHWVCVGVITWLAHDMAATTRDLRYN